MTPQPIETKSPIFMPGSILHSRVPGPPLWQVRSFRGISIRSVYPAASAIVSLSELVILDSELQDAANALRHKKDEAMILKTDFTMIVTFLKYDYEGVIRLFRVCESLVCSGILQCRSRHSNQQYN